MNHTRLADDYRDVAHDELAAADDGVTSSKPSASNVTVTDVDPAPADVDPDERPPFDTDALKRGIEEYYNDAGRSVHVTIADPDEGHPLWRLRSRLRGSPRYIEKLEADLAHETER